MVSGEETLEEEAESVAPFFPEVFEIDDVKKN